MQESIKDTHTDVIVVIYQLFWYIFTFGRDMFSIHVPFPVSFRSVCVEAARCSVCNSGSSSEPNGFTWNNMVDFDLNFDC